MSNTDKIHAAALELLRQEYHSVSIILCKSDHPTLDDEIYYAEGATLGRAVQNLWQDLRECPPGGERDAYLNFSDWLIIDAKTFCNLDPSVFGRLESLLDWCCPDVKRSLRARPPKGLRLINWRPFIEMGSLVGVGVGVFIGIFLITLAIPKVEPLILAGIGSALGTVVALASDNRPKSDRASGEGDD